MQGEGGREMARERERKKKEIARGREMEMKREREGERRENEYTRTRSPQFYTPPAPLPPFFPPSSPPFRTKQHKARVQNMAEKDFICCRALLHKEDGR